MGTVRILLFNGGMGQQAYRISYYTMAGRKGKIGATVDNGDEEIFRPRVYCLQMIND